MTLETAAAANASDGTSASGSSFYAAMRILPREQREAMFEERWLVGGFGLLGTFNDLIDKVQV